MKKWILIGVSVLIIVIIVLIIGISNLGPILKKAVNYYGPKITKTDVKLDDVKVSFFSGEAKLKDFLLGNPEGFNSPHAMKVKSIFVDLDEKSLTGDTIIIDKIEIKGPEVTYEKAKGTDNFKSILDNINSGVEESAHTKEKNDQREQGKKLIIHDFIMKDGKVALTMTMLKGKEIIVSLPDIHLKEIGKKESGTSAQKAFKDIFAALYSNITSPEVTDAINQGLKELGTNLEEVAAKQIKDLDENTKKAVHGITDQVKGLFNK
jgi:hypothetical protein